MVKLRYRIDEKTGCWNWLGQLDEDGYGPHRALYSLHVGPIPRGLDIDHLCRNRACVNPKHMEPVTRKVNVRRGSLTKLSADKVQQIRLLGQSLCGKEIARQFGISKTLVSFVLSGLRWGDIPSPAPSPTERASS